MGTLHQLSTKSIEVLVGSCLVLSLLCLNPVRATPPLGVFPGQWVTYRWDSVGNSTGWFPGYTDYVHLSAISTYSVTAVNPDAWDALVRMVGTVGWPVGSINHTLRLGTVSVVNESGVYYAWQVLGDQSAFDYNWSCVVDRSGAVVSMAGPTLVEALYTFPNSRYTMPQDLAQDRASTRSIYFLDDVDATVGSYVGAWRTMWARVLNHDYLETAVGRRPAIEILYNVSLTLPPPANITATSLNTFQYDRETGFLLKTRCTSESAVNDTKFSWASHDADIEATNMFFPRPELLLPTLVVIAVGLGALALALFMGKRTIGKRSRTVCHS